MATAERTLAAASRPGVLESYWRLVRPKVLAAVLLATTATAVATAPSPFSWASLAHAILGTGLLVAGALAMNQLIEQSWDARMPRTAARPLPSGRLTSAQAAAFAVAASLTGLIYLATRTDPRVAWLGGGSWAIYVLVYTPLKRKSVWQTPIGAVAGAMPVLVGAAVADALFSPLAIVLFAMVFFWQFPHSMAIAWLHREEFARGSVKVASVVDGTGRLAGWMAVVGAAGLLAASALPWAFSMAGWPYGAVALSTGLIDLALAASFLKHRSDASARRLRRGTLVHLMAVLAALILTAPA